MNAPRSRKKSEPETGTDLRSFLRRYITENFLPQSGLAVFKDSDSFMERGIIDSTGILELLEFVEDEFKIKVDDEDIVPENLDSLNRLHRFIRRKLGHAGQ